MSYSTLAGTRGFAHRNPGRMLPRAAIPMPIKKALVGGHLPLARACACPVNGMGSFTPNISQLAKFMENYRSYVLAFSPSTNTIAAYPQGMGRIAFTVRLNRNEPTDEGLSRARAIIDAKQGGVVNGLGDFNPHAAWGSRYKAAPGSTTRSGNGRSQSVPFFAGGGVSGVVPVVLDPPLEQQALHWDTPSLTLYMGSNKIALIPALLSALAVKVILLGGSKVAAASTFWKASDKAAKRVARA